ncbi:MAG: glycyl-radical enzyme activating protein [Desulfobacterales bacterium]|nr:glycyl-radical enzyme activating protein [Desulfobacterales bacterium]
MKQPLILEIKGNALDDGPGIRSVVFFKGCPLSCLWCHNPESKRMGMEIGFEAKTCVGCDTCISLCPEKALSRENPFFIDRDVCTLCFACVDACPSGALSRIGTHMSVEEIAEQVLRDKPFYDTSGGGVTLSGGEPALFTGFAGELAAGLKAGGIHILLETCGLFDLAGFDEALYPYLDLIYFDIKLMDAVLHARYCGVSNEIILNNFRALHTRARNGGVPVVPRTPLIPGITDTPENIHAIVDFLSSCGVCEARLLPYHPLWQEKNEKIGISMEKDRAPEMDKWLDRNVLYECRQVFETAGIALT